MTDRRTHFDSSAVVDLVASMTMPEKIAQITQVDMRAVSLDDIACHGFGSVFSGGGASPGDGRAAAWRDYVASVVDASRQTRLGIPALYGVDAVHGHNNVQGATIFPHNIGLGAADDPELVRRVAEATRREVAATGVLWAFAPCLAVARDFRWGRTFESFGTDPQAVRRFGEAAVAGLQGDHLAMSGLAACAKHFVGEGAMVWGTAGSHRHPWLSWWDPWEPNWQIDQGDIAIDEQALRVEHLEPFVGAIEAGVCTIMAGYASWRGTRLHAQRYLLTDLLKEELGFDGFIVSDWMAVDQIDPDYDTSVAAALNAGVDMVMVPLEWKRFLAAADRVVTDGRVPASRIDDAVGRILSVKAKLGLFDPEQRRTVPSIDVVGCEAHRDLAREAVRSSAVVLKGRDSSTIPGGAHVLAAGQALDDIGIACGGWTISWEGGVGAITEGTTILDGLKTHLDESQLTWDPAADKSSNRCDVGIVAIHELPYVEGLGDRAELTIDAAQHRLVATVRARVEQLIVVVISGRPVELGSIAQSADSIVAAWLPGSEASAIADLLAGDVPFSGELPMPWPLDALPEFPLPAHRYEPAPPLSEPTTAF